MIRGFTIIGCLGVFQAVKAAAPRRLPPGPPSPPTPDEICATYHRNQYCYGDADGYDGTLYTGCKGIDDLANPLNLSVTECVQACYNHTSCHAIVYNWQSGGCSRVEVDRGDLLNMYIRDSSFPDSLDLIVLDGPMRCDAYPDESWKGPFVKFASSNAWNAHGGAEIDDDDSAEYCKPIGDDRRKRSPRECCMQHCHSQDCSCAVFGAEDEDTGYCWNRGPCQIHGDISDGTEDDSGFQNAEEKYTIFMKFDALDTSLTSSKAELPVL